MGTTEIVASPPVIPSKWDIIPIHGSDIASFKRCRRYWDWTSPARNNLRRRVDIHGIRMDLWFGTGIHYALEMYYDPVLQRDPVESWLTWYQYQLEGGTVTEEWLDRTYDIHPQIAGVEYDVAPQVWRIRGLRDLLPNWEMVEEEFLHHKELGVGMMTFYKDWAVKNDDFVTVAAESVYSIPLGFEAIDTREDSPNYGRPLEVHARGKRDAIIYYPQYERFGINDHKTAGRIDDAYFKKLEKDEQCSNYLWATIQEAQLYDLPWKGRLVDRVLYTALRKNYPHPPTVLKSGFLSLDRQKEGTTAELFKEAIIGNSNLEYWFQTNDKAQAYYTYLCETADDMFVQRDLVTRNIHEIKATGEHLKMIAKEMLSPDLNIYPNPTGEFRCLECAFRSPCIAADDGSDWQGMLADGYEVNRGR
jgi:PD-(D/E)XK nuclease superfamily